MMMLLCLGIRCLAPLFQHLMFTHFGTELKLFSPCAESSSVNSCFASRSRLFSLVAPSFRSSDFRRRSWASASTEMTTASSRLVTLFRVAAADTVSSRLDFREARVCYVTLFVSQFHLSSHVCATLLISRAQNSLQRKRLDFFRRRNLRWTKRSDRHAVFSILSAFCVSQTVSAGVSRLIWGLSSCSSTLPSPQLRVSSLRAVSVLRSTWIADSSQWLVSFSTALRFAPEPDTWHLQYAQFSVQ